MQPVVFYRGSVYLFGVRFEGPVVALAALTLAVSIGVALPTGLGLLLPLQPEALWSGQVWRSLTWSMIATDPVSLVLSVFGILFFGNDVCRSVGTRPFLRLTILPPAVAALVFSLLVQQLAPAHAGLKVASSWALLDVLVIAWATLFPSRQMLAYFVLPIGGRALIGLTFVVTAVFALYQGFLQFAPLFLAQALTLAYLHHPSISWWLRSRFRRRPPTRRSHLRAVPRDDIEDPPRWVH